jgi:hypothetical protein
VKSSRIVHRGSGIVLAYLVLLYPSSAIEPGSVGELRVSRGFFGCACAAEPTVDSAGGSGPLLLRRFLASRRSMRAWSASTTGEII